MLQQLAKLGHEMWKRFFSGLTSFNVEIFNDYPVFVFYDLHNYYFLQIDVLSWKCLVFYSLTNVPAKSRHKGEMVSFPKPN